VRPCGPSSARSAVQLSDDDGWCATCNPNCQFRHFSHLYPKTTHSTHIRMSFLFGGGRPQPSSAEKIAAAEAEIDMVSDMYNRYTPPSCALSHLPRVLTSFAVLSRPAPRSVSPTPTARVTLTRASPSASTVASASSSRSTSRSPRRCRERPPASRAVLVASAACKMPDCDQNEPTTTPLQPFEHPEANHLPATLFHPSTRAHIGAREEGKRRNLWDSSHHALMSSAAVPYL
jgi:hypothetical protein